MWDFRDSWKQQAWGVWNSSLDLKPQNSRSVLWVENSWEFQGTVHGCPGRARQLLGGVLKEINFKSVSYEKQIYFRKECGGRWLWAACWTMCYCSLSAKWWAPATLICLLIQCTCDTDWLVLGPHLSTWSQEVCLSCPVLTLLNISSHFILRIGESNLLN